ncbi:MAG: hypothetical protein HZA79_00180 [Sphingobacteriales bacterium]|nr:hypothetical protein [Sphingobacteriales bacterium]
MYSFTTSGGIVAPTLPAQSPLFDAVDGNKFSFKWTNGNGAGRIVVARKNSAVDFVPADAVTYPANASFGNGPDLGGGQFVVYNGTGTLLALTNLEAATTYHFAVYEYNGSGSTSKYLTTALSASGSTVTAPAIISSNPITAPAASSIVLSWTNGNGSGRIVIAKEGSAVTASPVNLNAYSANAIFGNGPQVAVGEYVVYAGAGSSVTVTGLTANKTYHFSVFEYNGYDAPVYNTGNALTASATVLSALPVTWLYVNAAETNGKTVVNWATAQEINTEYYLVEKSSNGIDYSEIARVKAAGNSNQENHYSYTDKMNSSASAYYRIRQVDADNKYTYSSVVRISGALTQKIKLLQNPVQGQVRIQCAGEHMGATLRIVDVSGRELCRAKILSPLTTISTGHLKAGVYYIVFCDKSGAIETIPLINL